MGLNLNYQKPDFPKSRMPLYRVSTDAGAEIRYTAIPFAKIPYPVIPFPTERFEEYLNKVLKNATIRVFCLKCGAGTSVKSKTNKSRLNQLVSGRH